MTSIAFSPVSIGLGAFAAAGDAYLAQSLSPTFDAVSDADPSQSRFLMASSNHNDEGGTAPDSISPHFDEILDTFETRPETGELIFPRLEDHPGGAGGFEIRPTVLTRGTVESLDRLWSRMAQEIKRLMPDGHEEMTVDELLSNEIPLSDAWKCLFSPGPENNLFLVNFEHGKHVHILDEGDCASIETSVAKQMDQGLKGTWRVQKSRVALSRYQVDVPLEGLSLFLDLPRPIDSIAQIRLLLPRLGVAHFKTRHKTQRVDAFDVRKWRFAGWNEGQFLVEIGLWVFPKAPVGSPSELVTVSFSPWDEKPRPLKGEALRLWNWVRDLTEI